MSEALIAAHREIAALAPYLHLPIQSGSDRMLAAMNRKHRAATISTSSRACAGRGRTSRCRPISSSAIPARATRISMQTLAVVREVGFASAYAFKYSPRPGTPAAEMPSQIDEATKTRAARRAAGAARSAAAGLQSRRGRAPAGGAVREPGASSRSTRRPLALYAGRRRRRRGVADRRPGGASKSSAVGPNSLIGRIVAPPS